MRSLPGGQAAQGTAGMWARSRVPSTFFSYEQRLLPDVDVLSRVHRQRDALLLLAVPEPEEVLGNGRKALGRGWRVRDCLPETTAGQVKKKKS